MNSTIITVESIELKSNEYTILIDKATDTEEDKKEGLEEPTLCDLCFPCFCFLFYFFLFYFIFFVFDFIN